MHRLAQAARAALTSLAFLALLAGCAQHAADGRPIAATSSSAVAPAPELGSLDPGAWLNGAPASLASARGQVVLIDAWDRTCSTCVASIPAVMTLKARYEARGLRVLGVSAWDGTAEDRSAIEATMHEEKMGYPAYLDRDGTWQAAAGTKGVVPSFLVVDRQGRIAERLQSTLIEGSPTFVEIASAIERALAGPP